MPWKLPNPFQLPWKLPNSLFSCPESYPSSFSVEHPKYNTSKCFRALLTLGDDILRYAMMGANEVLASCEGWLMVSQSRTTSCKVLASSKMRSISACTSAMHVDLDVDRSIRARLLGLFRRLRLASEMSALTRVIITLEVLLRTVRE